jgi:predicted N-acetyltransferase YhbS
MASTVEGLNDPRPLAATDNRDHFDCGRASLNDWFKRHAWRNHKDGTSRVTVVTDIESGAVAGYVTLSAASIERAWLPKSDQRNRPDPLPAILLGQLAVDRAHQRHGCARLLMQFALRTAVRSSRDVGSFAVILHPLDENLVAYYSRLGFELLPATPSPVMAVRIRDLIESGF